MADPPKMLDGVRRVRLQPENELLEPIYADHVQILGKVTGVFRSL